MRFAEELAQRSTCARAHVGAVVTDASMLQVLGIGYNGNARGFRNGCDRPLEVGNCGCIHAELNALLKAPGMVLGKRLFTTVAPCAACAKSIINANVSEVFVRDAYRSEAGLVLLQQAGVRVYRIERDLEQYELFMVAPAPVPQP